MALAQGSHRAPTGHPRGTHDAPKQTERLRLTASAVKTNEADVILALAGGFHASRNREELAALLVGLAYRGLARQQALDLAAQIPAAAVAGAD